MKKYYCIAFALIVTSFACQAQPAITLGKPYGVIDAPIKDYFSEDGQIVAVKIDKKMITLQKLDAITLEMKSLKTYEDFPKHYVIEKVTQFKKHLYLFYSLVDDGKELLFCRAIDLATGEFIGKGVQILSVDEKLTGTVSVSGLYRYSVTDKYNFYFSYDSSSMVVQYRVKPAKRNDAKSYDVIGMHVFDGDMNKKWSKKVEMPYTEKKMDNLDYSVDAAGNVYIVTRVFDDDTRDTRKSGEDDANYHVEILKIAAGTATISTTRVQLKDKFTQAIWLYEAAEKGTMVCAGFYNKGDKTSNVDGIIVFRLGPGGALTNMNTYEIPLEILNQNVKARQRRKNERKEEGDGAEFSNLELNHVEVQPDGSIVLMGEKRYILAHSSGSSSGSSSRTYYSYHTDEILVTRLDASGKLTWMKKIPKRQTSYKGFTGISYRYLRAGDAHLFLFLDNEKNIILAKDKIAVAAEHIQNQGGFLTAYAIGDNSGEVVRETILNTRDVKGTELFQCSTSRLVFPLPGTLVFEAYKKNKEDVLVKVIF